MANTSIDPLEERPTDSLRQRRGSSFRRRLKRTTSDAPEVAMHVLLPKIFAGQIESAEYNSDEESVSSTDSAVTLITPSEEHEHNPAITISSNDDLLERFFEADRFIHRDLTPTKPVYSTCDYHRPTRKGTHIGAPVPAAQTQTSNRPRRPMMKQRRMAYHTEMSHVSECHDITPPPPGPTAPSHASNLLSGACDQVCHSTVDTGARFQEHYIRATGSYSRGLQRRFPAQIDGRLEGDSTIPERLKRGSVFNTVPSLRKSATG